MNEKERAAVSVGALDSGEESALKRADDSKTNCTTEGTGGQINFTARPGTIAAVLMTGRKNALSCTEISQITGADNRTVTKLIYQERRQGAPILSDTKHGYWLAESPEEIQRCVSKLHKRAREIHGTANAIWQSMERTV